MAAAAEDQLVATARDYFEKFLLDFTVDDEARGGHLPDLIAGDLDSLRDDVARFYETRGVSIVHEPEQDSHDFEKCLRWLQRQQRVR